MLNYNKLKSKTKNILLKSIFFLTIFIFIAIPIFADFIVLKDGNEYTGKLIKITENEIIFKSNNEEKTFKKEDVLKLLISKKRKFYDIDKLENLPDKNLVNYIKTPVSEDMSQLFNYVTILNKTEIKYENNRKVKEITKIIKVLNNAGIEQAANYYIWDPDNSNVTLEYAFTVAPNGIITHIDDSTINIAKYQVIKDYNSQKIIKFTLPDVVQGSTIVYKIKEEFNSSKNETTNNIYYEFFEESSNPVFDKELVLWVKKNQDIDILKYNNPHIEIDKKENNGYNIYTFKTSFTKKLEIEPSSPSEYDIYKYIIIKNKNSEPLNNFVNFLISSKTASTESDMLFDDFSKSEYYEQIESAIKFSKSMNKPSNNNKNEVSNTEDEEFQPKFDVSPEEYVKNAKIYAVFQYVDKTFNNISISKQFKNLHSPSLIIKNGYATYVEKVLLAYNLLNKMGFKPQFILAHTLATGKMFDPKNMDFENFDSFLFKIDDKYFIPLNYYIKPGLLTELFSKAYIFENGKLKQLPEIGIDFFKVTRNEIYKIIDENTTMVTLTIEYSPLISYSLRSFFAQNKNNNSDFDVSIATSLFKDATNLKIITNDPSNVYDNYKIKVTFKTSLFLKQSSNLGLINFEFEKIDANELSKDTRIYPLTYNGWKSYNVVHREILFPKKWSINFIPNYGKNNNKIGELIIYQYRFYPLGSFFTSLFSPDNVIIMDETYKREQDLIVPQDYYKFKQLIEGRNSNYVQYIVLNIKK